MSQLKCSSDKLNYDGDIVTKEIYLVRDKIYELKRYLLGRFLTIIDASISDQEQRKALKDITTQAVWDKEYFIADIEEVIIQFAEKNKIETVARKMHEIGVACEDYFSELV